MRSAHTTIGQCLRAQCLSQPSIYIESINPQRLLKTSIFRKAACSFCFSPLTHSTAERVHIQKSSRYVTAGVVFGGSAFGRNFILLPHNCLPRLMSLLRN